MTLNIENNGIKEVPQSFTYKINYMGNKVYATKYYVGTESDPRGTGISELAFVSMYYNKFLSHYPIHHVTSTTNIHDPKYRK